jgi:hypothetical protein
LCPTGAPRLIRNNTRRTIMHRLEKIVFEEEGTPDPDFDSYAVGGRVVEILKDGRSFRVEASMLDGMTADMRTAVIRHMQPRDSRAFPRTGRAQVVDSQGGTLGLHRPGFRLMQPGKNIGNNWLQEGLQREAQLARDAYEDQLTNAWKRRDSKHRDDDDDDEVEARCAAIRKALIARGADPGAADDYLADLDDPDLYDDLDAHIKAFEAENGGRATDVASKAVRDRQVLVQLYRDRDIELSNQWKSNK